MSQQEQLEAFMEKVKENLVYYRSHKVDEVAKYDLDDRLAHIRREATALIQEARVDELKKLKANAQRTYRQTITDSVGNVYMDDSHGYISSYELQERIAELTNSGDK